MKSHQTPKYILSRLRQIFFERMNPGLPWLTRDSILLLNQFIKKSDRGLEFGSGRSTRWLADRCQHLTSIEHYQPWYQKVSEDIENYSNVDYYYLSINLGYPEQSEYLTIFNSVLDDSVDFILNDGRLRDLVALRAVKKLRIGGLFILDNAERYLPNNFKVPASIGVNGEVEPNWKEFIQLTEKWRRVWTTNGVSTTLILFKS